MDQAAAAAAAAFHVCPCYEVLVRALLQYGPEGLKDKCVYDCDGTAVELNAQQVSLWFNHCLRAQHMPQSL
eukprot:1159621-Pelagomonas_calceolata.AAC.9